MNAKLDEMRDLVVTDAVDALTIEAQKVKIFNLIIILTL